jgi:hypothetical protein
MPFSSGVVRVLPTLYMVLIIGVANAKRNIKTDARAIQ